VNGDRHSQILGMEAVNVRRIVAVLAHSVIGNALICGSTCTQCNWECAHKQLDAES
jgi:hypothetical protein